VRRPLKLTLFIVGGSAGVLLLVAAGLLIFVDRSGYKTRLETVASTALGMEVSVNGRVGIGFLPTFHITLHDLHLRNRGTDVASAKAARLTVDLLPLLHREVRIEKVRLDSPAIFLARERGGEFNFRTTGPAGGTVPAAALAKISLADGTLHYADRKSGTGFEAEQCNLDARNLRLPAGNGAERLKHLSFAAQLACAEVRAGDFVISDLRLSVAGKDGVFDLKPITLRLFGAQGTGNIRADFTGAVPQYHLQYALPQFRIEEFLKTLSPQKVAQGAMDFSANLTLRGESAEAMTRSADGEVSLRGAHLVLDGRDLDRDLSRYESSQSFNLVDAGAFFFAGPLGLAVTKGYNFASIFQGSGGHSTIRTLVSRWQVKRGVAQAQDVAMATNEHRIALKGKLDFVHDRFDDVTMALIDARGCAKVRQRITGPFRKPVVEKPSALKSLAGPVVKLFEKGKALFPGGQCEAFYTGSVAAPK
jgi:uncharacterized protein involved in outer membrane biogenesis